MVGFTVFFGYAVDVFVVGIAAGANWTAALPSHAGRLDWGIQLTRQHRRLDSLGNSALNRFGQCCGAGDLNGALALGKLDDFSAIADFNTDLARLTGKPPRFDALGLGDLNTFPFGASDGLGSGGCVAVACLYRRGQQSLFLQFDGQFA